MVKTNLIKPFTICLLIAFALYSNAITAQNKVNIEYDFGIDQMLQVNTQNHTSQVKKTGWTVMLETSKSRTDIERAKQKFQTYYTEWTNWEYKSPYYKLMAGVFSTKLEAEKMLFLIKEHFPQAFPVKFYEFTSDNILESVH